MIIGELKHGLPDGSGSDELSSLAALNDNAPMVNFLFVQHSLSRSIVYD
jgi:hypothetical protein